MKDKKWLIVYKAYHLINNNIKKMENILTNVKMVDEW